MTSEPVADDRPECGARNGCACTKPEGHVDQHACKHGYWRNDSEPPTGVVQGPGGRIMGVDHDFAVGGPQDTPLASEPVADDRARVTAEDYTACGMPLVVDNRGLTGGTAKVAVYCDLPASHEGLHEASVTYGDAGRQVAQGRAQRAAPDPRIEAIRALADEWGCNCGGPSPEGRHEMLCDSYYGDRLRTTLRAALGEQP